MAQNGAHYAALRRQADAEFDAGQYYAAAGTYQAALALAPPQEHEEAKGTAGNSCDFQLEEALRLQQAMVLEPPADEAEAEAQLAAAIALSEAGRAEDDMLEPALAQTLAEAAAAEAEFAQAQRASREEAEALTRGQVDDIARAKAASRLQLDKDATAKAATDAKDKDELAKAIAASLAKSTKAAQQRVAESAASAAAMENGDCPICMEDLVDPVTTSDGFGPYCQKCITDWLGNKNTSPMTGEPLDCKELTPVTVEANVHRMIENVKMKIQNKGRRSTLADYSVQKGPAAGGGRLNAARTEAVSDLDDDNQQVMTSNFSVRSTVAPAALRVSAAVNRASISNDLVAVSTKLLSISSTRYCKGCKAVFDGDVCAREPPHPNFLYTKTEEASASACLSEAFDADFAAVSNSDGDATPPAAASVADVDASTELARWIDPCKDAEIQAKDIEIQAKCKEIRAKVKENQRQSQTLDVQKRLNREQQHLIQCIQDERAEAQRQREEEDTRRALELEEEEARRTRAHELADPPRECSLFLSERCGGEAQRLSDGIDCPSGELDHFTCKECFGLYVTSQATESDMRSLSSRRAHVFCPCCPESKNGAEGSTKYPDKKVLMVCSDEAFAAHLFGKERLTKDEEQLAMAVQHKKEFDELRAMGVEERAVQLARKHIEDSVYPHCPQCHAQFEWVSGCASMTCGTANCDCVFCVWCLADCNGNAHKHAAACPHKPAGVVSHSVVSTEQVQQVFTDRVSRPTVSAYIDSLDEALRHRVAEACREVLTGYGMADVADKYPQHQ